MPLVFSWLKLGVLASIPFKSNARRVIDTSVISCFLIEILDLDQARVVAKYIPTLGCATLLSARLSESVKYRASAVSSPSGHSVARR